MKEQTITLGELAEQLQRYEGQEILHAGNLAVAIMNGARDVEQQRTGKRGPGRPRRSPGASEPRRESDDRPA